jgi:hypothetical protein
MFTTLYAFATRENNPSFYAWIVEANYFFQVKQAERDGSVFRLLRDGNAVDVFSPKKSKTSITAKRAYC